MWVLIYSTLGCIDMYQEFLFVLMFDIPLSLGFVSDLSILVRFTISIPNINVIVFDRLLDHISYYCYLQSKTPLSNSDTNNFLSTYVHHLHIRVRYSNPQGLMVSFFVAEQLRTMVLLLILC